MDESAGNEYENLSIDIQLILYTEPVEYNHDHENNHGGNDGGTTVITEPEKSPEPTFDPAIDEPLPTEAMNRKQKLFQTMKYPWILFFRKPEDTELKYIYAGAALIVIGFCLRADDKELSEKIGVV